MSKRALIIIGAIAILGLLAYVGVSSANGSYGTAIGIGAADVTAAREGNAVVAKVRSVHSVRSAKLGFTSGLFADRKSAIGVAMAPTATLAQVQHVLAIVRETFGHGDGQNAGAVLDLSMPGAPQLRVNDFSMSSARLKDDLSAWESLRAATGTLVEVQLRQGGGRNLEFVSGKGATYSWVVSHYSLLKTLSAEGFTWIGAGVCSVEKLPDEAIIEVIARLSRIVPELPCNSSTSVSGFVVASGGDRALMPFVVLGFANGTTAEPFSSHAKQFAEVSAVLLNPDAPNMNIGYFGAANGKLTVLRFFTGLCAAGVITNPDKTDATSVAILKAHGIDVVKRATIGQCSPKQQRPSASPTPGG